MSQSNIKDWSTAAASNNNASNGGMPEGQAPSTVNDNVRVQMAAHRVQWEDAEWFNWGHTVGFSSASEFTATISGTNSASGTNVYSIGRRVKIYDASGGVSEIRYGSIISISAASANSYKVNCAIDSGAITSSISSVAVGVVSPVISTPVTTRIASGISGYARNLVCLRASASTIDIDADEIVLTSANSGAMVASSINLTVDITASGANGLDTGAEASGTWYYGWVIATADGTKAGLLSASATAPTLPTGYIFKALVCAVRNDGSSNFIAFRQHGNQSFYTSRQTVSTGLNATSDTSVSTATTVPPGALTASLIIAPQVTANGAGSINVTLKFGFLTTEYLRSDNFNVLSGAFSQNLFPDIPLQVPNVSQTIYYDWDISLGSDQLADVYCVGFTMNVGV